MDVINVDNLCKRYENFRLQDISFRVPEGAIAGFIGRNGAGKTTTIRLLLDLATPTSGECFFFGGEADARDPRVRSRIGTVLDGGVFFEDLRIRDMKRILASSWPHWSEKRFSQLMELFGLHPRQQIRTLSRGMHAQLALAFALSHEAELLILDEPTSGLDPVVRRELLTLLKDFMLTGGQGVLFSTHITTDLERVADEVILIDDGRILFQQDRDELLERHRLVKGPLAALTPPTRRLLSDIRETPHGFTAITAAPHALKELASGFVFERPSLEDIMVAYTKGGAEHARASA